MRPMEEETDSRERAGVCGSGSVNAVDPGLEGTRKLVRMLRGIGDGGMGEARFCSYIWCVWIAHQ